MIDVELLYRQHLTDADLKLLHDAAGPEAALTEALGSAATENAVFGAPGPATVSIGVSPFLAFATAVHRTARRLETTSFVEERWGPRVRIPIFDVSALTTLLSDQLRRWFLVELLASYTKVSSGVTWTRTARGWRRRRFSELDPASLAEQLQVVGPSQQPGVYRRLGDLALFILGVFPDHIPSFGGPGGERLLRLSGVDLRSCEIEGQELLQYLGSRWYRAALSTARASGHPVTDDLALAGEIGERFHEARRVLNAVTDRYLFPLREQWFGG